MERQPLEVSTEAAPAAASSGSRAVQVVSSSYMAASDKAAGAVLRRLATQPAPGGSGNPLPDDLRSGVEQLSGQSMDSVRVHYNSSRPAQVAAAAFTEGNQIHTAPGEERQLPHEAWHVVQQAQGRVAGTTRIAGREVNDNRALEVEADQMGARAAEVGRSAVAGTPPVDMARSEFPSVRRVIQRRDMREVMIDQRARSRMLAAKESPQYTTVGFEWDIARTVDHSDETPNILQGLTHIELAEGDVEMNGLRHLLETDAGNVIEFVTPPFLIATQGPGSSIPQAADLNDVISSTRGALARIVTGDGSIGGLLDKSWAPMAISAWADKDLSEVGWRNWSPRARGQDDIAAELPDWRDVEIVEETTAQQPQINIASTSADYARLQGAGSSRLGEKDSNVVDHAQLVSTLEKMVATPARKLIMNLEPAQQVRMQRLVDRIVQVMAQQRVVADIEATANAQKRGIAGEDVTNDMRKHSGPPSYVKDTGMVWLKTDLFSFAAATLQPGDWAALAGKKGILSAMQAKTTEGLLGKKAPVGLMARVLADLLERADALAKLGSSDKKDDRNRYMLDAFKEISKLLPDFNEHDPRVMGVRQDTFISPLVMTKLSQRLKFGSLLSVLEVRNTGQFLELLESGALTSGGTAKSSRESSSSEVPVDEAAVATINVSGVAKSVNDTEGDGNCFFHALHESMVGTRSTAELQQAVRQRVIDALVAHEAIAQSHFGERGMDGPEGQHFGGTLLMAGAWVTDQTPSIVSDALNWRIVIHRPNGDEYFRAEPTAKFWPGAAPTEVHLVYTGNHYNSLTNPALPPA